MGDRFRNKVTDLGYGIHKIVYTNADGDIVRNKVFNRHIGEITEYCEDVVTPNYQQIIKDGGVVNGEFYYTKDSQEYLSGSQEWTKNGSGRAASGVKINLANLTALEPYVSNDYPTGKALAKVDATPYAMMEDIGEIRETLRFLNQPLFSLKDIAASFSSDLKKKNRRRRRRGSRRTSKKISAEGLWLEYRFAVMPLLRSVYNIAESLQKDFEFPERRIARANSTSQNVTKEKAIDSSGNVLEAEYRVISKFRCGVAYNISNPVRDWRAVYGLRAKDIPVTLWNLLPLSFMVDRMINISDSIKGAMNILDPNIHFVYGWKTGNLEHTRFSQQVEKIAQGSNGWHGSCSDGGVKFLDVTHHRLPWSPSAFDLVPKVDLSGLVSSITNTVDLVALIVQLFKGGRRP